MSWKPNGPVIQTLPVNSLGRDLILGDVHGCRSQVDAVLKSAGFDPTKDRVFSVGDLTDWDGPNPMECLELLNEPWFFHTLGNHDFNLIMWNLLWREDYTQLERVPGVDMGEPLPQDETLATRKMPWEPNDFGIHVKAQWVQDYYRLPERQRLDQAVDRMLNSPHIYKIGEGEDRFHVVHAGLHPNAIVLEDNVASNEWVDQNRWEAINPYWGTLGLLTNRYREVAKLPNLDLAPTYCGHTHREEIQRFAGHVNIDTGAGKGGKLTLICHQTQEVWQENTEKN